MRSNYDPTEQESMMKEVGETMMDYAAKENDHKKANAVCVIGQDLSLIGTLFSKKMHEYNEDELEIITEVTDRMGLTKEGRMV
mgnify:CR=1 FL=1